MAFTSADLTAIEAAILTLSAGDAVAMVTFANGHTIRYREADMDKLLRLRALVQRETGAVHRRVYAGNAGRCSQ